MPRKPPASNARKKPRPKLTEKEELFCQYYLVKLNSTEAAIKAGFSARTAKEKGYQLRHKPHIEARISELYAKRIERVQVDADFVLREVVGLYDKAKSNLDDEFTHSLLAQALKALEMAGKHVTVGAFKDTIDHNHKGEIRTVTRRVVDPKEAT